VSERRIAAVLEMDVGSIRQKRDLLNGICKGVAEILKTKHVAIRVFSLLKKTKPVRQIEVTELLVTTGNFLVRYVKALFAVT
jgi:hypothetical protein